jgi:1-acyl-sn-glycerol-3-phosphate acyltransferase
MTGKTGAARLALLAPDVPVIPVAQWGIQHSIDLYRKKVRLLPRPRHVVSIGEPVDLSAYAGAQPTAEVLRDVTDEIMRRLRDDVAELRGESAPTGPLFHWVRPTSDKDAA